MRIQFSLLTTLLATAAVGIASSYFAPRSRHVLIEKTGRPLDLAIVGEGYFEVQHPDGTIIYTRSARLATDKWGQLVLDRTDYPINPNIQIPDGAAQIDIASTGQVHAWSRDGSTKTSVGQLTVSTFPRPSKMWPREHECFALTDASGQAIQDAPGNGNSGYFAVGWLERDTAGFWSYENPTLIVLVVIIAAIAIQTLIFGKLITAAAKPTPVIESPQQ